MYPNRIHFAEIKDGQVVVYPVCPIEVNPYTCESNLPVDWAGGIYEEKEYVFCHNVEPFCDYKHNLVEVMPKQNPDNGLWYRQYEVVPATAEEIADRTAERARMVLADIQRMLEEVQAKQEYISSLTQPQIDAWSQYTADLQAMPQNPDFPWIGFPQMPSEEQPEIGVTRV